MSLTDIEGDESCKMTFSDGAEYHVKIPRSPSGLSVCCKPRRENKQRMIEFQRNKQAKD